MATFAGLVPPPRDVPRDVVVRVFAHRDVYWACAFLVVAAMVLSVVSPLASDFEYYGLVILSAVLWLLAARTATPHLVRANRTLRLMQHGLLVPGRVVASRFAWDKKGREMPHTELLSDWALQINKSTSRAASSLFDRIGWVIFGVPFLAMALFFLIAMGIAVYLGHIPMDTEAKIFVAIFVGVSILVIAGVVALSRRYRRWDDEHGVELRMKQRRLVQELQGKSYEEIVKRLLDLVKGHGPPISIKEPLPKDSAGIELICRVDYGVGGELVSGEGRVMFSKRLNLAGVEPLLFDPARPGKVLFLAGLPETIAIDATYQWAAMPSNAHMAGLAVTAIVAIGVLLELLSQLPRLL